MDGKDVTRVRVLIAEDHPVSRAGLVALVDGASEMTVVATASDGAEAVELFRKLRPDVTLMDLGMPRLGGLAATAAIRAEFPEARVIVLTALEGDEDMYRALEAGARGYLLKNARSNEILDAIRVVHAGQRCIPPAVAARLAERPSGPTGLTPRESEVLSCLVRGENNEAIAARLGLSPVSVKSHVNRIFSKLGVRNRTQAMAAALERGLVHLDP